MLVLLIIMNNILMLYDLFGFERKDIWKFGPLFKGQGKEAETKVI